MQQQRFATTSILPIPRLNAKRGKVGGEVGNTGSEEAVVEIRLPASCNLSVRFNKFYKKSYSSEKLTLTISLLYTQTPQRSVSSVMRKTNEFSAVSSCCSEPYSTVDTSVADSRRLNPLVITPLGKQKFLMLVSTLKLGLIGCSQHNICR